MASWPYRTVSALGYWGHPTSTENFCEVDYDVTHYIAEFINTLTSIGYVFYAWHGIRMIRGGKMPEASWLPYLALAGVGVFSAVFHATLWVETQRCDGLSMLVAASATAYRVMTFDKSPRWSASFSWALLAWLGVASWLYISRDVLIVHQSTFGLICAMVAFKTRALMHERVRNATVRKRLLSLARAGTVSGFTGFGIWLIDNFACEHLRAARGAIGLPWGFLLEFHGWWHILTGISSYIYMTLVEIILTDPEVRQGAKYDNLYAWPMPALLALDKQVYTNGHANGGQQRKRK